MDIFVATVSLCIALSAMIYAAYLHIYYHNKIKISERQIQEYNYRQNMKKLGINEIEIEEELKKFFHIADLINANKKLTKAIKKHKLDH